nr:hypothetical protein [Tanacetum cinerariifolium]
KSASAPFSASSDNAIVVSVIVSSYTTSWGTIEVPANFTITRSIDLEGLVKGWRRHNWDDWRQGIADLQPKLLVLIPHIQDKQLYIGNEKKLALGSVQRLHVGNAEPVMIVIGCNSAIGPTANTGLPAILLRVGAKVVIGSLTSVLGRFANTAAVELTTKLIAASKASTPVTIGYHMTKGFDIRLIQAEHGDAILVSYGENPVRHLLVDGGPASSFDNLIKVLEAARTGATLTLEAIVVTHYDFDHIGGIIALLKQPPCWLIINDIWFNGSRHLVPKDMLGKQHSDALASLILDSQLPWNNAFQGKAVCASSAHSIVLEGGVEIWLLSPTQRELTALAKYADAHLPDNGKVVPRDRLGRQDSWPPPAYASLLAKRFLSDQSASNASSIAMLLRYGEQKIVLCGDARAEVICAALASYWPDHKLKIDFWKMSHHGSQGNTSSDLLNRIKCKRFAFSTNGKIHAHPDQLAIVRVLASTYNPELIFNYANQWTNRWKYRPASWPTYSTTYPSAEGPYVRIII